MARRPGTTRRGTRPRARLAGAVAAVAVAAVVITAVGIALLRPDGTAPLTPPPPAEAADVVHWLSADRVPPGDHTVAVVLVNRTDREAMVGVTATVERWDGDGWLPHGYVNLCQDHWACAGRVETSDGPPEAPGLGVIAPARAAGAAELLSTAGLTSGWYRLVRTDDDVVVRGVLEVADGVPSPPPHPRRDRPSLAIRPAVVATAGGPLALVPHVPARNGSLTAEMITDAVAGLGGTARVDRWTGSGWAEGVAELPLVAEEPDTGTATVVTETGPLAAGTYRVVRRGAGRALDGLFWVDDVVDPAS